MFSLSMNQKVAENTAITLASMFRGLYRVVIDRRVYIVNEGTRRQLLHSDRELPLAPQFTKGRFSLVSTRVYS